MLWTGDLLTFWAVSMWLRACLNGIIEKDADPMVSFTPTRTLEQAKRFLRLVTVAPTFGLLSSCTDLMEPAPEFNSSAHAPPQQLTAVTIHGFQPGQHVAGTITLTFDGLPTMPKPAYSTLTLSPTHVLTSTARSPSFTFPASWLPEGTLIIHFTLFADGDPTLGMLNLLDQKTFLPATAAILDTTIPLIIDLRAPTGIQNLRFDWPRYPTLSWSLNTDPNFRCYIIRRTQPTAAIDTVYQQSQTSFIDSAQHPYLGAPVVYQVSVWNGREESAGKAASFSYGTPVPMKYDMYSLLASPVADEMYWFLPGDTLMARSTTNLAILRTLTFSRTIEGTIPLQGMTPDGSVLYWFDPWNKLLDRVGTSDFQRYPDLPIAPPHWADEEFVVTTRRIYEVMWGDGGLACLDAETGNQIGGTMPSFGYGGAIALSPDEKTLYGATVESQLFKFDVSADSFSVQVQVTLPGPARLIIPIAAANAIGVFIPGALYVLDAQTLAVRYVIAEKNSLSGLCSTASHIYVSNNSSVVEYDLSGVPTGRQWDCPISPYLIATDRNGTTLFAEVSAGGTVAIWTASLQ